MRAGARGGLSPADGRNGTDSRQLVARNGTMAGLVFPIPIGVGASVVMDAYLLLNFVNGVPAEIGDAPLHDCLVFFCGAGQTVVGRKSWQAGTLQHKDEASIVVIDNHPLRIGAERFEFLPVLVHILRDGTLAELIGMIRPASPGLLDSRRAA